MTKEYIPVDNVTAEHLKGKKLFVGTPMYGGQCFGSYTNSLVSLIILANHYGVEVVPYFLFNESLITRARNYVVDAFLRTDCTHLLFIDSDIGFRPEQTLYMLGIMEDDSPYDVLCGLYPKKALAMEKVVQAVNQGVGEENPDDLLPYLGDLVFNPLPNAAGAYPLNRPIEILEGGTGFMMIRREAFSKYKNFHKDIMYRPDHTRSEDFNGDRYIGMYFQAGIDPWHGSERYLSEDYWFCQGLRMAGGRIWAHAGIDLTHTGTHIFTGSLSAMASLGITPTADDKSRSKKKK